jgi:hypothetical protein
MRPPWSEAAALMGAAGFSPPPAHYRPSIWSRYAMQPAPFALLPRIDAVTRPIVFADLNALAAHIERGRGQQGLELVEVEDLHFLWRAEGGGRGVDAPPPGSDRGVQVWTRLIDGGRDRCLGWAWLNGGGLETLQAALRRAGAKAAEPRSLALSTRGVIADGSALRSRLARSRILGSAQGDPATSAARG